MLNSPLAAILSPGVSLSSVVTDYSACCGNSFGGRYNQVWRSLVKNPAIPISVDPESSGGIYRGGFLNVSSTDPVFVGQSGVKGSYFSFDGTQFMTYTGLSGTPPIVTGFAKDWHKTTAGKDFSFLMRFYYVDNGLAQTIFSTKASGSFVGLSFFINNVDKLNLTQRGGSGAVTATTTATLVGGNFYVVGVSHSHTNNRTRIWLSDTAEQFSQTFNATVAAPTAALTFGATFDNLGAGSLPFAAGTLVTDITILNEEIDDTKFVAAKAEILARNV